MASTVPLDAASAGREEAARQLRAAAPRMLAVATLILRNSRDAEDAVQDAMLVAWRQWDQLRDSSRTEAWLTKTCVRQSLRNARRLRIRGAREMQLHDDAARPLAHSGDAVRWDEAFERLSRRQRAVVVLHYHYGYTLDECAELMGCRPGSARQHLARALRQLREKLA